MISRTVFVRRAGAAASAAVRGAPEAARRLVGGGIHGCSAERVDTVNPPRAVA